MEPSVAVTGFVVLTLVCCFGVVFLRFRSVERGLAVAGLSGRQRLAVWRSVWAGRRVRGSGLAAAAIELAHRLDRESDRREQQFGRWFRWPVVALEAIFGVFNVALGRWFSGVGFLAIAAYFAFGLSYSYRRAAQKRAASITANLAPPDVAPAA